MKWIALLLSTFLVSACCSAKVSSTPEGEPTRTDDVEPEAKPDHVPCDPTRPELPCTPEMESPEPMPEPGVKPDHVPCDPARPELPCTPEEAPDELMAPEAKPQHVPCDPAKPEMPCTPDNPPE